MKKNIRKIISLLMVTIFILSAFGITGYAENTVPEGYTGVYTIEDLYCIRYGLDKNYILMNDLDLTEATAEGGDWDNGYGWAPIGEDESLAFTGIFNGNGHTIKGMQIRGIKTNYAGLFGYVKGDVDNLILINFSVLNSQAKFTGVFAGYIDDSEISEITINNCEITTAESTKYVGGLSGYSIGTSISGMKVNGSITNNSSQSSTFTGGILGYSSDSTIYNCVNNADIFSKNTSGGAENYSGGIVGYIKNSSDKNLKIYCCYNTGAIYTQNTSDREGYSKWNSYSRMTNYYTDYYHCCSGGICGKAEYVYIENCYNIGDTFTSNAATTGSYCSVDCGSAGICNNSCYSNIINCINLGTITSVNGKVSSISDGENLNCYYLVGTAPSGKYDTTDTATTAVALTATQMKLKAVFGYLDFENVWFIKSGMDYPQLIDNPETEYEHTHNYVAEVTAPTCTEQGYTTYTCSCGDSYVSDYVSPTGHHHTSEITKAATCTETGVKTFTCSCGDTYTETISALGHDFGEWKVTKPATTTATGVETRYCSRCTAYETRIIPKLTDQTVELNNHNITMNYKATTQLVASNKNVEWTSSNTNVAIVDSNGMVTATGTGNVVIKATIKGTDISDSCQISVSYAWWQWIIEILLFGFLWY